MELLCIQSQEHDKLPLAELNAVIECEDMELDISKITEGLILLKDISDENSDKYYQTLVKRLGYTHEVDEVIFKSSIDDLEKELNERLTFKNVPRAKIIKAKLGNDAGAIGASLLGQYM